MFWVHSGPLLPPVTNHCWFNFLLICMNCNCFNAITLRTAISGSVSLKILFLPPNWKSNFYPHLLLDSLEEVSQTNAMIKIEMRPQCESPRTPSQPKLQKFSGWALCPHCGNADSRASTDSLIGILQEILNLPPAPRWPNGQQTQRVCSTTGSLRKFISDNLSQAWAFLLAII